MRYLCLPVCIAERDLEVYSCSGLFHFRLVSVNYVMFFSFVLSQSGQWALLISLLHGGAQAFITFAVFKSRGKAITGFWLT